jgi:5'(3')-deoxyribonucleotidase
MDEIQREREPWQRACLNSLKTEATVEKSTLAGIVLGVDLDGVCADFYARMREIAAEWFERRLKDLPREVSFGLKEWGISNKEQYQSLHRFAVTQRELFKTVPMIAGSRKYLRMLSNEGARIRIVTHRLFIPYFHNPAVAQTIDWLDKNGIPYWDLCFMKDKEQVGADIYVDDSPHNIKRLRAQHFYAICFANSTNRRAGEPHANTWDEVYQAVHKRVARESSRKAKHPLRSRHT